MKKEMIGFIQTCPEFVRKEYLSKKKKHPMLITVEIYKDKRYGAIAKIFERNSLFDRCRETTTIKQRKDFSESLKKSMKRKKPLDTSKWVKPDEESIRIALIESLFALEILKEDCSSYGEYHGKAKVLYAIIHDHSPSNPQRLGNWCIDPYFQEIMATFKSEEHKKYWRNFDKSFKKKNKTKGYWKKRRKEYLTWVKKVLSKMIIKDPNPPKRVDIFKRIKRIKRLK